MTKILDFIFGKKSPGLDLAVAVITGIGFLFLLDEEQLKRDYGKISFLVLTLLVYGVSFFFFRVSKELDDVVFDELYKPGKPCWVKAGKGLRWKTREAICQVLPWKCKEPVTPEENKQTHEESSRSKVWRILLRFLFPITFFVDFAQVDLIGLRERAAKAFCGPDFPAKTAGLYNSAKMIFGGTEEWEDKVKAQLEFSKAARIFILPMIILFLWQLMHWATGMPPYLLIIRSESEIPRKMVSLMESWPVVLVELQLLVGLYLYLRIRHMRNLYKIVCQSRIFRFDINEVNRTSGEEIGECRMMISVGSVVIPKCELRIFKNRILCVGIDVGRRDELSRLPFECLEVETLKINPGEKKFIKRVKKEDFDVCVVNKEFLKNNNIPDVERLLRDRPIIYIDPPTRSAEELASEVKKVLLPTLN